MRVFHITEPDAWRRAATTGRFTQSTRGASLDDVGFVHRSFADQVERVAGYVYGPIPVQAVVAVHRMDRSARGRRLAEPALTS